MLYGQPTSGSQLYVVRLYVLGLGFGLEEVALELKSELTSLICLRRFSYKGLVH